MHITFDELRKIKHALPTGSISQIAKTLKLEEQTVRNFFGANKFEKSDGLLGWHMRPGPNGGVIEITDSSILNEANKILSLN